MVQKNDNTCGYIVKVTTNLQGVSLKKNCVHTVFNETLTHSTCISVERSYNVELDKIMFCLDFCFPKEAEAVKSKMTG